MSSVSRRRVSYSQLEALWEILNENRSLATGYNKTSRARELSRKMWERIAENLNSFGDGATKDWKAWCKYWNDYKSKLKSRVAGIRASHQRTGGGPSNESCLSDLEEKFLQILGQDFGSGIAEARVEPFDDDTPPVDHPSEQGSISLLQHWLHIDQTAEVLSEDQEVRTHDEERQQLVTPSPVTPVVVTVTPAVILVTTRRSPRLMLQSGSPTTAAVPSAPALPSQRNPRQIQHLTPRLVRQRQRREAVMTQDAARRALIADSQERTRLSQEKLILLRNLVMELKEIKNKIRSPVPATADE